MFSNLSEIQKLNLKYRNPLLDFTGIILSFQTILKFTTVALCSKNPYCKHHWTDEARVLSWEKHDGILLYLTQISTQNQVLARFYTSHVISIISTLKPFFFLNQGFDWKTHTGVITIQLLVEILFLQQCSQSGPDLNAAYFSMKLINVDTATRLSNTFCTFMSAQANARGNRFSSFFHVSRPIWQQLFGFLQPKFYLRFFSTLPEDLWIWGQFASLAFMYEIPTFQFFFLTRYHIS